MEEHVALAIDVARNDVTWIGAYCRAVVKIEASVRCGQLNAKWRGTWSNVVVAVFELGSGDANPRVRCAVIK